MVQEKNVVENMKNEFERRAEHAGLDSDTRELPDVLRKKVAVSYLREKLGLSKEEMKTFASKADALSLLERLENKTPEKQTLFNDREQLGRITTAVLQECYNIDLASASGREIVSRMLTVNLMDDAEDKMHLNNYQSQVTESHSDNSTDIVKQMREVELSFSKDNEKKHQVAAKRVLAVVEAEQMADEKASPVVKAAVQKKNEEDNYNSAVEKQIQEKSTSSGPVRPVEPVKPVRKVKKSHTNKKSTNKQIPEKTFTPERKTNKMAPENTNPKGTPKVPKREVPEREVPEREVPKREVPKREVPEREVPKREVPKKSPPDKLNPVGLKKKTKKGLFGKYFGAKKK